MGARLVHYLFVVSLVVLSSLMIITNLDSNEDELFFVTFDNPNRIIKDKVPTLVLSQDEFKLKPGERVSALLKIGNNFDVNKDFKIIYDCVDNSKCSNIHMETPFTKYVEANQLVSVPVSFLADSNAIKGEYIVSIQVKDGNDLYASSSIDILVQ